MIFIVASLFARPGVSEGGLTPLFLSGQQLETETGVWAFNWRTPRPFDILVDPPSIGPTGAVAFEVDSGRAVERPAGFPNIPPFESFTGPTLLLADNEGPRVVAANGEWGPATGDRANFLPQIGGSTVTTNPRPYIARVLGFDDTGSVLFSASTPDFVYDYATEISYWVGDGRSVLQQKHPQSDFTDIPFTADLFYGEPAFSATASSFAFQGSALKLGSPLQSYYGVWSCESAACDPVVLNGVAPAGYGADSVMNFPDLRDYSSDGRALVQGHTPLGDSIWAETATGELRLVIREGQPAPGGPLGAKISYNLRGSISEAGVTVSGFWPAVNGSHPYGEGVWADFGEGLKVVALRGDAAPGRPGEIYWGLSSSSFSPAINSRGKIAFTGYISQQLNGPPQRAGIWAWESGVLREIVLQGEPTPDRLGVFGGSTLIAQNNAGQILFGAGVTRSDGVGVNSIWLADDDGFLTEVIRSGQWLDVDPGLDADLRQVESFTYHRNLERGDSMQRSALNDSGQVALMVRFTDGTAGIFRYDLVAVPEPCTFAAAALAVLIRQARRRHA